MTILTRLDDNIWTAEGNIVDFYGFAYPTRSVIVRLPNQKLWIWSPITLGPELKAEIDALGSPAHLVSPNKIHHLFLPDWKNSYPDAQLWGPHTTIKKRNDLMFAAPLEHDAPPQWQNQFEQAWFFGSPFLEEIVFFHRPSRTAILADMSENFSETFLAKHWSGWQRWIARLWGIVEGKGYAPLELRLTYFNRKPARAARDKILGWHPQRVIMAHGRWQAQNGEQFLKKAFEWI
ncbi:DUF4336 domain-containing protein [Devosia rhodophyticola]|uniref:DUF4336 domain-containing protein n=1 Tax=Devosia rhodophyticola TaxID=3026423 RepID=A0ABY7YTH1_9HYPH|nr:DUF4336 domain-containing protein [Devosia rhodophyticola]WDR04482.1 DUF4336 domain-containing protein [Devosia rhodophyticola]